MNISNQTSSGYRWVVLFVFALLNAAIQIHWIALAPITAEAAAFYHVTPLSIGFQSMLFMLVYIVICVPASQTISAFGTRIGVGLGAVLIGVCGAMKGLYASNYAVVTICQVGLAVAQPFVLNAATRVGAEWFPIQERATATGLAVLSQYVGIIVAMALTPILFHAYGIGGMLTIYGAVSIVAAAAFLVFFKSAPGNLEVSSAGETQLDTIAGVRHIFRNKQMRILLFLFFIGIGIFNAVTTWIEEILSPRGFTAAHAGSAGAIMMVGGIIGALILPPLSDKFRRRVPFLIMTSLLTVPGIAGLALATNLSLLIASSFLLGFASMSAGPIGFQYGAELSRPAPESMSQGLLLLGGQTSGAAFIFAMQAFRPTGGTMTPFMLVFVALTALNALLCTRLRESDLIRETTRLKRSPQTDQA